MASNKVTVLVAVKPTSMGRVIVHLFRSRPDLQIVEHRSAAGTLARHAGRVLPDLIVANTRSLGKARWETVAQVKRFSPNSKLIVLCPLGGFEQKARESGADAYLEEEALVRGLLDTVRKLAE